MTPDATADTIKSAVAYIRQECDQAPAPPEVVAALLAVEKQSKRDRQRYLYEPLLGTWRLGFVSGTKTQARPKGKPIKVVGNGRFLPQWVKITITYAAAATAAAAVATATGMIDTTEPPLVADDPMGAVTNAVRLGALTLQLQGPTRYWPKTNSLGFDFTQLQARLGSLTFYKGGMRGGESRNRDFRSQTLKDQAFFTYFMVQPDCIAARGKGGGLALWVRSDGGPGS